MLLATLSLNDCIDDEAAENRNPIFMMRAAFLVSCQIHCSIDLAQIIAHLTCSIPSCDVIYSLTEIRLDHFGACSILIGPKSGSMYYPSPRRLLPRIIASLSLHFINHFCKVSSSHCSCIFRCLEFVGTSLFAFGKLLLIFFYLPLNFSYFHSSSFQSPFLAVQ